MSARNIVYPIAGAVLALIIGALIGIGRIVGSSNLSILIVALFGMSIGVVISQLVGRRK